MSARSSSRIRSAVFVGLLIGQHENYADYVHRTISQAFSKKMGRAKRNTPCECGSGKLYKFCCYRKDAR